MDLNGDGNIDVLSGSYSRMDETMAGLFQVFWGQADGTFQKAAVLNGTDGEPLIIPAGEDVVGMICTRPTAVDFDGDGHLDIVSGNFGGSFYLFRGEGKGTFQPAGEWLTGEKDKLTVPAHSDPVFADWDGDGDLDLLSGSSSGGAFLFTNTGSRTASKFAKAVELIKPTGYYTGEPRLGDEFLTGPQSGTRIWVDDLNGDGKLDLLVGDNITLMYLAEGVTREAGLKALDVHNEKQQELYGNGPQMADPENPTEAETKALDDWRASLEANNAERDKSIRVESTGFVWAIHRK